MNSLRAYAVACAFPTSREDFDASLRHPYSEYAKRFVGGWSQYEPVCSVLQSGMTRYRSLGVLRVEERVKQATWREFFDCASVAILFAHHIVRNDGNEYIELWDTVLDPKTFAQLTPAGFTGVVDLSVCGPGRFVDQLKRHLPNCTVSYSTQNVSPMIWSQIYGDVFELLIRFPGSSYEDVLTKVILEYRKQARGGPLSSVCNSILSKIRRIKCRVHGM
jgi:hypothetical protein